jgi:hypothetical protein
MIDELRSEGFTLLKNEGYERKKKGKFGFRVDGAFV